MQRSSDAAEFEGIVKKYYGDVYRVIMGIVGNEEDAKDLTQETFLRAYLAWGSFEGRSSVRTWLIRIALNRTTDFLRKKKKVSFQELDDEMDVESEGKEQFYRVESVREVLEMMNPAERLILMMFYMEGFSQAEIAKELGISVAAVKMRLKRAKTKFAKFYESHGNNGS